MSKNVGKSYPKPHLDPMTFVNRKLNADEKDAFELWFSDQEKADIAVTKLFHEGYKSSIQWVESMNIFNALTFPPKEGNQNSGLCLSSKGNNWYKAIAMNAYKHYVLTKESWSTWLSEDEDEG